MNYFEFRKRIEELPYFETKELKLILGGDFSATTLVNLKNWLKKGHLIMLRRGLYAVSEMKSRLDSIVFATKIYSPSYVSMETALSFYGIIPEAVFTVTSITTRKTNKFSTPVGNFSYQKIKKEAFGGFETRKQDGVSYNMALPEKAMADFLYLNRNILDGSSERFRSYRFNEEFEFDVKKLMQFSKAFKNKKLSFLIDKFIEQYVA